ncbi:MAG TPA: TniB family NTP-binding protein [Blastocatellia bacterium]|nr:TniB family NTP-binding protein [Blastocatellia bacterium]
MRKKTDYSKMRPEQRIRLVEQIYISYPRLDAVLKRISYCHRYSKYAAEPECFFIKGPSGAGKTTIMRSYKSKYPTGITENGRLMPVLAAGTPTPATVKSLATALLDSLGDPAADKGSTANQTLRLYRYIKNCGVELIMLDEFQHFIDQDSQRILLNVSDWLKNLINETNLPMILIGLPYSDQVLDANVQLKRRFSSRQSLDPFSYKTDEQWEDFRRFLKAVDTMLPFNDRSHLADQSMAYRFYHASGGIVAYVMKIVRGAAKIAINQSIETLTLEVLAQAYEDALAGDNLEKKNPFENDIVRGDIEEMEKELLKQKSLHTGSTNRRIKGRVKRIRSSDIL